jgi:hypothetical protein
LQAEAAVEPVKILAGNAQAAAVEPVVIEHQ